MNATPSPRKRPSRSAVAEALRDTLTVPSDSIMDRPPVNVTGSLNDIGDQALGIKQALNRLADAVDRQNLLLLRIADSIDPPRRRRPSRPKAYRPAASELGAAFDAEWEALKEEREGDSLFHPGATPKPPPAA